MENASKALIIAGGALVSMLIITLFIYALSRISEYQTNKEKLFNNENIAQFNQQFTVYNRDDLQGYEVFSLISRVIDYNERFTNDSKTEADSYKKIEMTLDMTGVGNQLTKDNQPRLFKKNMYTTESFSAKNRNQSGSLKYDVDTEVHDAMSKLPRSEWKRNICE